MHQSAVGRITGLYQMLGVISYSELKHVIFIDFVIDQRAKKKALTKIERQKKCYFEINKGKMTSNTKHQQQRQKHEKKIK